MTRLTDEELRRMEMDADTARQYYARNGKLPTATGLDALDRVASVVEELRDLRALLHAPWDHSVSQPPRVYDTRDPRVIFRLHRADHSVPADHAIALGAALVRAGLAAQKGGA